MLMLPLDYIPAMRTADGVGGEGISTPPSILA